MARKRDQIAVLQDALDEAREAMDTLEATVESAIKTVEESRRYWAAAPRRPLDHAIDWAESITDHTADLGRLVQDAPSIALGLEE